MGSASSHQQRARRYGWCLIDREASPTLSSNQDEDPDASLQSRHINFSFHRLAQAASLSLHSVSGATSTFCDALALSSADVDTWMYMIRHRRDFAELFCAKADDIRNGDGAKWTRMPIALQVESLDVSGHADLDATYLSRLLSRSSPLLQPSVLRAQSQRPTCKHRSLSIGRSLRDGMGVADTLTCLNFSSCRIGDAGARVLADALWPIAQVARSSQEPSANRLNTMKRLRRLLLNDCGIGDTGAIAVATSLHDALSPGTLASMTERSEMRELCLANNRITDASCHVFGDVFAFRSHNGGESFGLLLLDLSGNPLGDDGVTALLQGGLHPRLRMSFDHANIVAVGGASPHRILRSVSVDVGASGAVSSNRKMPHLCGGRAESTTMPVNSRVPDVLRVEEEYRQKKQQSPQLLFHNSCTTALAVECIVDVFSAVHDERLLEALAIEEDLALHAQYVAETQPMASRAEVSGLVAHVAAIASDSPLSDVIHRRVLPLHALRRLCLDGCTMGDHGVELLCSSVAKFFTAAQSLQRSLVSTVAACKAAAEPVALLDGMPISICFVESLMLLEELSLSNVGCTSHGCVVLVRHLLQCAHVDSTMGVWLPRLRVLRMCDNRLGTAAGLLLHAFATHAVHSTHEGKGCEYELSLASCAIMDDALLGWSSAAVTGCPTESRAREKRLFIDLDNNPITTAALTTARNVISSCYTHASLSVDCSCRGGMSGRSFASWWSLKHPHDDTGTAPSSNAMWTSLTPNTPTVVVKQKAYCAALPELQSDVFFSSSIGTTVTDQEVDALVTASNALMKRWAPS